MNWFKNIIDVIQFVGCKEPEAETALMKHNLKLKAGGKCPESRENPDIIKLQVHSHEKCFKEPIQYGVLLFSDHYQVCQEFVDECGRPVSHGVCNDPASKRIPYECDHEEVEEFLQFVKKKWTDKNYEVVISDELV